MNDTLEFDTGLVTIRAKRWGQEEVSHPVSSWVSG